ncbi:zinc finger SWIM domain-containing protein 7 isoform X6 [Megalobrama amblycephala]|uniref:zinc finger SWIM domain-containing protein 7 isoform X6 n=1 Tax=Megalobrama amblycephala TaxID=75352 RepID=UPI002013F68D|nr:zinc finger SWIM domain-containing protein 7 isoform X6 [Megalobrama amblycephala]
MLHVTFFIYSADIPSFDAFRRGHRIVSKFFFQIQCLDVFRYIMDSSLRSVAEQLLKDLQRTYSETNQIPDDLLIALRFVFGPCALQALDLVDQRSVTCVSSPSSRKAFQDSSNDYLPVSSVLHIS